MLSRKSVDFYSVVVLAPLFVNLSFMTWKTSNVGICLSKEHDVHDGECVTEARYHYTTLKLK